MGTSLVQFRKHQADKVARELFYCYTGKRQAEAGSPIHHSFDAMHRTLQLIGRNLSPSFYEAVMAEYVRLVTTHFPND